MRPRQPLTTEQATIRAEELCAASERSSGEIRTKLYRWGIPRSDAERIVEHLVERRFVDDSRFAAAYVRDKLEFSGWGRLKISAGLYAKGIDRSTISEALDAIDSERYAAVLDRLIARLRRDIPDADTYEGRTRIFRRAASRGFEPSLIAAALRAQS